MNERITDDMVEALAEFICAEFDFDLNPVVGAQWPEHANDDGYRGDRAYVRLQPSDVQARARENATRILTFLDQRAALQHQASLPVEGAVCMWVDKPCTCGGGNCEQVDFGAGKPA